MKQIVSWDEAFSTHETTIIAKRLALAHLELVSADEPRESIVRDIHHDDFNSLCNRSLTYDSLSVLDAYHLRQALAFFQKRDDLELGVDKEAVAFQKFTEAEQLCGQTNVIFRAHAAGRFQFDPYVEGILHTASRKIARVLGDVPSLSDLRIRFGPGATTNVRKTEAGARQKLGSRFQCSEELLPILTECLSEMPGWLDFSPGCPECTHTVDVDIVPGKLAFVPKNARTHRSIGVEPGLNSMFQLGIGDYMASRLAAFGIDITDQTRNQRLARYGSLTGALATLDLSSASDTVATELVAHLLPLEWFLLLSRFRTSRVVYRGEVLKLQKFSSMGNGFTFPLETLIFWALASACTEEVEKTDFWCSAYGDDIIVPTAVYPKLCHVLRCIGFIPNTEKSYGSGPFRESCGADYLSGFDIRPFYLRSRLSGESLFTLHNFYVRNLLPEFASLIIELIHPIIRKWGPDGYGDGHLVGEWVREPSRRRDGWGGYTFETFTWKAKRVFKLALPGDRVLPLYSIYVRGNGEIPRPTTESGSDPNYYARMSRLDSSSRFIYDRKGRLGTSVPGKQGYKLISIYTFS